MSRYYIDAHMDDPNVALTVNWLPGETAESVDATLRGLSRSTPLRALSGRLPERLLRALCAHAGVEATTPGDQITREGRRGLVRAVTGRPLPITGSRGYTYGEATGAAVPRSAIRLETMESRVSPGL